MPAPKKHVIILMAGLPGTGKSTLAQALATHLSGSILNKDEIRHALFSPGDIEYSTAQDDFCMEIMLQTAGYIFKKDRNRFVFLDGRTFSRRYQVERVLAFGKHVGQSWRIVECTCSDHTAKTRLEESSGHPAGNRNYSLYLELKSRFEEIALPKVAVDTDLPLDECVSAALNFLRE